MRSDIGPIEMSNSTVLMILSVGEWVVGDVVGMVDGETLGERLGSIEGEGVG